MCYLAAGSHADMKTSRSHLLQSSFLKGQFQSDRTVKVKCYNNRAISDRVSKAIRDCFGFPLSLAVISLENSRQTIVTL